MTKRELIEEVVNARTHLPRREVEALVNGVFGSLAEALARGERIEIRGFGSFIVKRRNAREGLNPKTGEVVTVSAKRVAFFKAGKELKQRVDERPLSFARTVGAERTVAAAAASAGTAVEIAQAVGDKQGESPAPPVRAPDPDRRTTDDAPPPLACRATATPRGSREHRRSSSGGCPVSRRLPIMRRRRARATRPVRRRW